MAKEINPFIVTGKIEPEYFCDRVKESERLVKSLTNGNNLVIISPRRMGKTGLIRFCYEKPEIKEEYYTFFIDILHTSSLREFTYLLGKEIYETLLPRSKKMASLFIQTLKSINGKFGFDPLTNLPTFNLELGDIDRPEYTLEEIFQCLIAADKPCIVAIDEFQQIAKYPEKNIEALLRTHIQKIENSNFIFADPFDYFYTPVNEFQFTNTLSPITNLSYHSCGNKQDGEDRLRAYFASNINKISGIGFKLDYLYGRGYYNNQATSLFNGSLYGYYLDDRYNMHAWISVNHMRMGENGGIENDDYITHPEDFTRSYGSRDIPTILSENWNRNEDQTYYLTHRYNLGFYKDIELPDSLRPVMPADSVLLKGLRDSLLTVYQKADTAYQHAVMDSLRNDFMVKQDNPQDFIPVTSFIHTLRIRNAKHTVYSYDTPDHYYADLFYGDPNNMSDRTRGYSIQNTLGIALREGFNKWAKAGLTAFASHEYRHYTMPDLNGGNKIIRSYSENNISVGGQLSKREGKTLHYDVTGEVTLLGEDVGQFDVEGRADLNFRLFKDTVQLAARAFVKNLNPSFYMRHYHSQFAWWDNDLNKEFRTRIEGCLLYTSPSPRDA
mgnify:CR=1 FL=1